VKTNPCDGSQLLVL